MYKTSRGVVACRSRCFHIQRERPRELHELHKTKVFEENTTLFDPTGFLAPFTIRAKMLIKDMWTAGLKWDDKLIVPLINSSRGWFGELGELKNIQVPRCVWY